MNKDFLEMVVRNEICGCIYHNPDDRELKVIMDYVDECVLEATCKKKQIDLTSLALMISNAVHDNFVECEECGEKFLPDEMNMDYHKCLGCQPIFDPESMQGGWYDKQIERDNL